MNKLGIIITLCIVLLCMGTKFNSFAMNSSLNASQISSLKDQLKKIDAEILKKEEELESATFIDEFELAKELNSLRKKKEKLKEQLYLPASMQSSLFQEIKTLPIQESIPASECPISRRIISKLITPVYAINTQPNLPWEIAWNPDGTKLAILEGSSIRIWDPVTNILDTMHIQQGGNVASISWSLDGNKLAAGLNHANGAYTVELHSIANGIFGAVSSIPITHSIFKVLYSPTDTNKISVANGNNLQILNVTTGASIMQVQIKNDNEIIYDIAWSPDGNKLAIAKIKPHFSYSLITGTTLIWDTTTGNLTNFSNSIIHNARTLAWSPDGNKLAMAIGNSDDIPKFIVEIWNITTKNRINYIDTPDLGYIKTLSWNPNGATLAIGGTEHTLIVDPITGERFEPLSLYNPNTNIFVWSTGKVAWTRDGNKLAETRNPEIRVWDTSIFVLKDNLNINQCDLLQALDSAILEKGRIQATKTQWHTFRTLPDNIQNALQLYIKQPAQSR